MKHPRRLPRRRSRAAEDAVLIKCRRRCCLCVYFNGDHRRRNGQLAHMNKDRSSPREEDLVFLCTDIHHNEFDSVTRQCKNVTQGELRHYKAKLEDAVANGELGLQEACPGEPVGLRFAAIEVADESSWFEMSEHNGEDFTLFTHAWRGASGEGELPASKDPDPIFDVTMLNGGANTVVSAVGVVAKRSYTKLAGVPAPERVAVFDRFVLNFEWLEAAPQWIRPPGGPVVVPAGSPYRFTLGLRGYTSPGNYGVIALLCRSDSGVIQSDGICLGR